MPSSTRTQRFVAFYFSIMQPGRIFNISLGASTTQTCSAAGSATGAPWDTERDRPRQDHPVQVVIAQRPCIQPLTVALRLAPLTKGMTWTSHDPLVDALLRTPLEADFQWLQRNIAMNIDIADVDNIAVKYPAIMGSAEGMPSLSADEYAALYKWGLELDWSDMGMNSKSCIALCAAQGGEQETQAFYVEGVLQVLRVQGSPDVFRFEAGQDRCVLLTGIALPPGDSLDAGIDAAKELHMQNLQEESFESVSGTLQMLPVQYQGDPGTSTAMMGLDRLVGARTDSGWEVVSAAGNFAARVDKDGIACETIAMSVQRLRSLRQDPKCDYMLHDECGNQTILLTSLFLGEVEFQIQLGNECHVVG